jgi:hypothetical protein
MASLFDWRHKGFSTATLSRRNLRAECSRTYDGSADVDGNVWEAVNNRSEVYEVLHCRQEAFY